MSAMRHFRYIKLIYFIIFIHSFAIASGEVPWNVLVDAELDKESPLDIEGFEREVQAIGESGELSPKEFRRSTNFATKMLLSGQSKQVHQYIESIVRKLGIIGDKEIVEIGISADPYPNAGIYRNRRPQRIEITLGLLSFIRSEDELAGILAHEFTHGNPKQFQAQKGSDSIDDFFQKLEKTGLYDALQREEIRADVGAIQRLIKAGYSPWGFGDLFERIAQKRNADVASAFLSNHPVPDVRLGILKAAVLYFSGKKDGLTPEQLKNRTPLPLPIRVAAAKAKMFNLLWKSITKSARFTKENAPLLISLTALVVGAWQYRHEFVELQMLLHRFGIYGLDDWFRNYNPNSIPLDNTEKVAINWTTVEKAALAFAPIVTALSLKPIIKKTLPESIRGYIADIQKRQKIIQKIDIESSLEGFERFFSENSELLNSFATIDLLATGISIDSDLRSRILGLKKIKEEAIKERIKYMELYDKKIKSIKEDIKAGREVPAEFKRDKYDPSSDYVRGIELSFPEIREKYAEITGFKFPPPSSPEFYKKFLEIKKKKNIFRQTRELIKDQFKVPYDRNPKPPEDENEDPAEKDKKREEKEAAEEERQEERDKEKERKLSKLPSMHHLDLLIQGLAYGFRDLATISEREAFLKFLILHKKGPVPFLASWYLERLLEKNWNILMSEAMSGLYSGLPEEEVIHYMEENAFLQFKTYGNENKLREFLRIVQGLPDRKKILYHWVLNSIRHACSQNKKAMPKACKDLKKISDHIYLMPVDDIEKNVKNIRGLKLWVEQNLPTSASEREKWGARFTELILHHPEWIETSEDVWILLKTKEFWPTLGYGSSSSSEVSQTLLRLYRNYRQTNHGSASFHVGQTEKIHNLIINKMKLLGMLREDSSFEEKYRIWEMMSRFALTSITEDLFTNLVRIATPDQVKTLEEKALKEKWISDPRTHADLTEKSLKRSELWKKAISTPPDKRESEIKSIIEEIQQKHPNRGLYYDTLLEKISRELRTSKTESELFQSAKGPKKGEVTEDLAIRSMSALFEHAIKWTPEQQWELILFLRGDIPCTPFLEQELRGLGSTRIKRDFQLLPVDVKATALEIFLGGPRGLFYIHRKDKTFVDRAIDHMIGKEQTKANEVSRDMLRAFMHAIQETGNEKLQSYVLSFLLAQDKEQSGSAGKTLKNVLEYFGATGIKLGQFLATSGLLSPEDTKILSELQSRAKIPDRHEIYRDLEKIFKGMGIQDMPYEIDRLLGAASMKYAVLAKDKRTGKTVVLKVLREDSLAHTQLEFAQLDAMVNFLSKKYGSKYAIFKSVAKASKQAVSRELSLEDEVKRSDVARTQLYANRSDENIDVIVPQEKLLAPRLIEAELATGRPISDLPEEDLRKVARKVLELEHDNLRANTDGTFSFNPDTHMGNFLAETAEEADTAGHKRRLHPIDFGQLLEMTAAQRTNTEKLFAIAQILSEVGSNWSMAKKVAEILSLNKEQINKLQSALKNYFPIKDTAQQNEESKRLRSYFALLTALEDAGTEVSFEYFEYVRAILQQPRYERELGVTINDTAHADFARSVKKWAGEFVSGLEITAFEKLKIVARILKDTWQSEKTIGCSLKAVAGKLKKRQFNLGVQTN